MPTGSTARRRYETEPHSRSLAGVERVAVPSGFELLGLVGRGSFCEIWKIRESPGDRPFVLKVLSRRWRDDPTARRLLECEARVGSLLRSRHVAKIMQAQTDGDAPWVIAEWLEGVTLEEKLHDAGRLPVGEALWIARQCAEALHDLYEAGYAHGDLKPQNMVVTAPGEVKLIDLGFAKPVRNWHRHDRSAELTGTPEYMAPETLSREKFNPAMKDVYSLGVTLFRMLTGQLPFQGTDAADVLRMHREIRPPMLQSGCPSASRELSDLVQRMMAKHPVRRPQHPGKLVRELIDLELVYLPMRIAG